MTARRQIGDRRGGIAANRAMLGFAVLLAFLLQSFVTATHFHNPTGARAAPVAATAITAPAIPAVDSAGQDNAKQPAHRRAPAEPANCPICHAVAQSGNFLTPAPIVLASASGAAIWLYTAAFGSSAFSRRSHAWQSRAPPA